MDPADFPRRVLLCVSGLSPQVVTETIYALARQPAPWIATEICVVTTQTGAVALREVLLAPGNARLAELGQRWGLPLDLPSRLRVIVPKPRGEPLVDIRSEADSAEFANTLVAIVRQVTADPSSSLHVSLAGGRKTMSYYAGSALSVFGRPQDRLSHVLVRPEVERDRYFFFPRSEQDADAVTLHSVPFVRLRPSLPPAVLEQHSGFAALVESADRALAQPGLVFRKDEVAAGGQPVPMPKVDAAFYRWLCQRQRDGLPAVVPPPKGAPEPGLAAEFLPHYQAVAGEMADTDRVADGLRRGMDREFFERRCSGIKRSLRAALGEFADPYLIQRTGKRPRSAYRVGLDASRIVFEPQNCGSQPSPTS